MRLHKGVPYFTRDEIKRIARAYKMTMKQAEAYAYSVIWKV